MILASFANVMSYVFYVLIALLVLLIMITVHELGHYIAGKIFKFGIEEFSIGFGPKIFKKKTKSGETFAIGCIPLGGYCAFTGEDEKSDNPSAFGNKKPWQRIIVLISGALMNYLLALLIIIVMFGVYGQTYYVAYDLQEPTASVTAEQSLKHRDVILEIEGNDIYLIADMMDALEGKKAGEAVDMLVIRDGERQTVEIVVREDCNFKNYEDVDLLYNTLGLKAEDGLRYTKIKLGFFQTIGRSFEYSISMAGTIFVILGQLLTGKLGLSSMGGTVTTISFMATATKVGKLPMLLDIASLIGVNLAVFNLLPFPALDGSRVVFTTIEWIRGKPINKKIEGIIHTIGLIFLLGFAVLVDVLHLF